MPRAGTANFSLNLTRYELETFRRCAYAEGLSLAEWIRRACLAQLVKVDFLACAGILEEREQRKGTK
jgi:hypothetical protein